jgi:hypothetical protein
MRDGESIRKFQSAKDAMEAVESYVESYVEALCQYHRNLSEDSLEIS